MGRGVYIAKLNQMEMIGWSFTTAHRTEVNLSGFKVYDDATAKYTIASGTIPPHGYFILHCDGAGVGGNAVLNCLDQAETIYLENNKGSLMNKIAFPAIDNGRLRAFG